MPHTATADPGAVRDPDQVVLSEGAETFDSGNMFTGDEFRHTFTVPGVAACGSDDSPTDVQSGIVEIEMFETSFSPSNVTIERPWRVTSEENEFLRTRLGGSSLCRHSRS